MSAVLISSFRHPRRLRERFSSILGALECGKMGSRKSIGAGICDFFNDEDGLKVVLKANGILGRFIKVVLNNGPANSAEPFR